MTPNKKSTFFIEGLQPWTADKIDLPARTKKPATFWLLDDMMSLPEATRTDIMNVVVSHPQHRFCVQTTYTHDFREYMESLEREACMQFLQNLWVGTFIEREDIESQVFHLLQTPAAGHFVHCRPRSVLFLACMQCGEVGYNAYTGKCIEPLVLDNDAYETRYKLDWLIVGEGDGSIMSLPMYPAWVSALQFEAEQYSVPFYYTGTHYVSVPKAEAEKTIDSFGNVPSQTPAQTCYLKWSGNRETRMGKIHYKQIPFAV